jgi:hypothetical protein
MRALVKRAYRVDRFQTSHAVKILTGMLEANLVGSKQKFTMLINVFLSIPCSTWKEFSSLPACAAPDHRNCSVHLSAQQCQMHKTLAHTTF